MTAELPIYPPTNVSSLTAEISDLTLACVGGGVGWTPPPWFFANNSRKKRPIATKLSVPSHWSILHLPWKFHDPDPNDLWPVTSFPRPCLAGIAILRMSARISRAFASFSWFQTFKHVIWCCSHAFRWVSRSPESQVRSLTFGDLGSLFRV